MSADEDFEEITVTEAVSAEETHRPFTRLEVAEITLANWTVDHSERDVRKSLSSELLFCAGCIFLDVAKKLTGQ